MTEIVDYQPDHAEAFKRINEAWITRYFEMEESDKKMLNDPRGNILEKGGAILIALLNEQVVGTCALIKKEKEVFELAKMAVSPAAQGKKIGWNIGLAVLEKARQLGARRVYLETNSILTPAINLYKKLGFRDVKGKCSPYVRCNVQMEITL